MTVTVDSTAYTADATWPSADGFIPVNIVQADLSEPVGGHVTADTTAYSADNTTWPRADGGVLPGAADLLDAIRIPAVAYGGGGRRRTRLVVVGVGYGILPELEGEAHGVVGVTGEAAATLPISGAARGEVDDGLDELIMLIMLAA